MIVYKISNNNNNKIYIGSTSQNLKARFNAHKYGYNSWKQRKSAYVSSYELFENNNECMIEPLIILDECTKIELKNKESEFILENRINCVNKNLPARTKKSVYQCQCGSRCTMDHRKRHEHTHKHISFVNAG